MSTVIKSSEVSGLLAIEVPYDNYFVLIAYERRSLSHYVATIRENYKYAVKDKAYHCFYKALERFAGDPDTAKEICDMSNTLIKERRAAIKEADKLWSEAEVLGEVTNKSTLGKRRRSGTGTAGVSKKIRKADKITSKICRDLLKPFESVPRKVEDLKVLINAPLACKLPVSANIHERRIQKFTYLDATDRDCQLASHISYILGEAIPWRFKEDSKSEDMLHMPLDLLITNTLELFKESVGIPLSIDRNKSDSGYTTKGYFRPDFVCRIKEALIFKGEEKASHVSIKTAEKELKEKFNRIDPQVFGNINFFLCYAAAGSRLRFYTIDGSKNSSNCLVPLSNEFDIVNIYDRFEIIKMIINIARIVKSIIPSLP